MKRSCEESQFPLNVKRVNREKNIQENGLDISYTILFSPQESNLYFQKLEHEVEYMNSEETRVKIYGRYYPVPRKMAAYGDENVSYKFSGLTVHAKPWTPTLLSIKQAVEKAIGEKFNFVLINRYKNGHDSIGAHKDDEKDIVFNSSIGSVSFGQERYFKFTRNNFKTVKILLENGSLLTMKPPTNSYWYHSLPRCAVKNTRINLTFRRNEVSSGIS